MSHLIGVPTRNAPFSGIVVRKQGMAKTVMVQISRLVKKKKYNKPFKSRSIIMVHDEDEICDVGDKVMVQKSKPYSKRKRHKVHSIAVKDPAAAFLRENPEYTQTPQTRKQRQEEIKESMREVLLRSLNETGGNV